MTADELSPPSAARVTVAVMPREKFCCIEINLRSLLENTKVPFELLYIDAGSPPAVQQKIDELLADRPHTLHRVGDYLPPFAANAIAIATTTTEFLVVVDNDVYAHPGWLQALIRCADEENADAVTPVMLIGEQDSREIHSAGGETAVVTAFDGRRRIAHRQFFEHQKLDDPDVQLQRQRTERVETHAVFARLKTWQALGELDPAVGHITNVDELSLRLAEIGADVWFEPTSRVVYLYSPKYRMGPADIRLMGHVWSERWIARDLEAINDRRNLSPDETSVRQTKGWFGDHRRLWLIPAEQRVEQIFDRLRIPAVGRALWKAVEKTESTANRMLNRA